MSGRCTMIKVQSGEPGFLQVEDWRGRVQNVSVADLGAHVQRILADPDLPDLQVVSPGVGRLADFIAQGLPPEDREIVVPGLQGLSLVFSAVRQVRATRAAARTSSPPPDPPPPPRAEPPGRGPAFRRGQRFG